MITNYQLIKEDVLKMYQDFSSIVEKVEVPLKNNAKEALERQAENIRKDRFLLMVAGEAKSGKSTFINSFLGKEILPMDVKQCTSAIVEIKYGDRFTLRANYADGRTREIIGEQEIKDFLLENASLNDDFREIPVTTINNEILIKSKEKQIPNRVINDLIKGVESENIYGLSPEEYSKKIRSYIETNKNSWADIVTKMVITYPFANENLQGMQIIDSPGVNAEGRVGDVTNDYIKNANAIMFLKPITGAALESTSFRNFLDSQSVERNKNALFLILTRAANENPENLERLQKEALKLYGNTIEESQIICLDSKVELFNKKISGMTTDEIDMHLDELESNGRLDAFIAPPRSMKNLDKEKYIAYLKNKSNFLEIEYALNIFGRKSHYLALSKFLEHMEKTYEFLLGELEEQIKNYKLKGKDPIELAAQIGQIKNKLNKIEAKMGKTVDEIVFKYTGESGIIKEEARKQIEDFLNQIEKLSTDDLNQLEKIAFNKIDGVKIFQEELQKNMVAEFNTALIDLSNKNAIRYTSLEPDFTTETFEQIKRDTKASANKETSYETGRTFKKTHQSSKYSQGRHFKLIKNSIEERITKIQKDAISNLIGFANDTQAAYISELFANAKSKKEELNRISEEKKNAEEIQEMIEDKQKYHKDIVPKIEVIREIKGGIDAHVRAVQ